MQQPSVASYRLPEVLAVGGNDLFVPVKGLFLIAVPGASAVIVAVHIDEAVTLAQLAGGEGHHIDAAPRGAAQQIHAVQFHGLFHLLDMSAQIVDAVAVIAGVVRFQLIDGTEAVLHDEQRLFVPLVEGRTVGRADDVVLANGVANVGGKLGVVANLGCYDVLSFSSVAEVSLWLHYSGEQSRE